MIKERGACWSDTLYQGKLRKLILQANRNGFVYLLDRTDGTYLGSKQFALTQNWAKSIDLKGRPIRTELEPSLGGTRMCPSYAGGTNWYSPTYSERTHLFYFIAFDECSIVKARTEAFEEGKAYYSTGASNPPGERGKKALMAYDPIKNTFAWTSPQTGPGRSSAGVISTASGLVAFGDDSEEFEVVDGLTGAPLYHFNVGQPLHSSPLELCGQRPAVLRDRRRQRPLHLRASCPGSLEEAPLKKPHRSVSTSVSAQAAGALTGLQRAAFAPPGRATAKWPGQRAGSAAG